MSAVYARVPSTTARTSYGKPVAFSGLRHDPWAMLFAVALNLNLWLAIAYAIRFMMS